MASFSEQEIVKEPLIIYRDILIPLMRAAGFVLDFDQSDQYRYHTRFIWSQKFIDNNTLSETYGQIRMLDTKVDVIGIPIGRSFLILHGIIIGISADQADDVKLKIRCSYSSGSSDSSSNKQIDKFRNCTDSSDLNQEISDEDIAYRTIRCRLESEFVYKIIEMLSLQLGDLPYELKIKILSFLPINSICAMSRVSSIWHTISIDDQLWKLLVRKFYPDCYSKRVIGQSWKALFKDQFRREKIFLKREAATLNNNRLNFYNQTNRFLALPSIPLLLPIAPPPFVPMLPAPEYMFPLLRY